MNKIKFILKRLTGHLYTKEIDSIVAGRTGNTVVGGPFAGMRYIDKPNNEGYAAKLVGTYEMELIPAIEHIQRTPYSYVLNVGSSEGYYAVGLAMRMPSVKVIAYDIDPDAVLNVRELARRNGVAARVETAGLCDHHELNRYRSQRSLVLCDIEGGEAELLDPNMADALIQHDILVEIHDGRDSTKIHDLLVGRFEATHALEFISCRQRDLADCPRSVGLWHPRSRRMAIDEQRTRGIEWGFFRAKRLVSLQV